MYRRIGQHQNGGKFDEHGGIVNITTRRVSGAKRLRQAENNEYWRQSNSGKEMRNRIKPCARTTPTNWKCR